MLKLYDVIVEPKENKFIQFFCSSIDRSGYILSELFDEKIAQTLNDVFPILTHADMGMGGTSDTPGHDMSTMETQNLQTITLRMGHGKVEKQPIMNHSMMGHDMSARTPEKEIQLLNLKNQQVFK